MLGYSITSLHQIEITSRCNLRCRYCVHPTMPRAKQDMDEATYTRSLYWAKRFSHAGTQRELNLAGIGESTMHPDFVRWVHLAREAVGEFCQLVLATNGLLVTKEMAQAIKAARPMVWVSLHRPEKAGPAVEVLKAAGILSGISADPSIAAMNWAGQVKWHMSAPPRRPCPWVRGGRVMAMSDGRITTCCLDGAAVGVLGHVEDNVAALRTQPYSLCATCDQDLGIPGYAQHAPRREEVA